MNCEGCGSALEPTIEQVNSAVDQIMETSLRDAEKKGGVCPLCGHSKQVPYSNRKTVLFGLLVACLIGIAALWLSRANARSTKRNAVAKIAVQSIASNPAVTALLGSPVNAESGVVGEVKEDETGWKEARLTIPIRGPRATAVAHVIGGQQSGAWKFSTYEIEVPSEHKKLDIISGRIVEYDPDAYVDVHTQSAGVPTIIAAEIPAPRLSADHACVYAVAGSASGPTIGTCMMPADSKGTIDRFEVDLRSGSFVARQTDLALNDVFEVPLTRTYASSRWMYTGEKLYSFGKFTNHTYDIAPIGSRNPYTYLYLTFEDGDFLRFDRISQGTGYADAVYRHSESSSRFYRSTIRWNGNGWTLRLEDGSEIIFPEAYNAKSLAQGAPTEFRDPHGNVLALKRDGPRNLQEISTPNGHSIRFTYDGSSRITRAEDDARNWTTYSYNDDGLLTDVVHSSGTQRHYQYQEGMMTLVTDENNRPLIRNWYSNGCVIRQQYGNGETYSYTYDWRTNEYAPRSVTITGPDGKETSVSIGESVPNAILHFHK